MTTLRIIAFTLTSLLFSGNVLAGGKKGYHCEVKKNGKTVDLPSDEVPNRKACKAKGGKWIKDHDHSHGDGADHDHEEEE